MNTRTTATLTCHRPHRRAAASEIPPRSGASRPASCPVASAASASPSSYLPEALLDRDFSNGHRSVEGKDYRRKQDNAVGCERDTCSEEERLRL